MMLVVSPSGAAARSLNGRIRIEKLQSQGKHNLEEVIEIPYSGTSHPPSYHDLHLVRELRSDGEVEQ